jgi:hypothetical protein
MIWSVGGGPPVTTATKIAISIAPIELRTSRTGLVSQAARPPRSEAPRQPRVHPVLGSVGARDSRVEVIVVEARRDRARASGCR